MTRFLTALLLTVFSLVPMARAEQPIFHAREGAAIGGYDTVAYFTDGRAVPGAADIMVMWKGVVWHFSSDAHREAFEANPRAYAPQYGGYCAYAVSFGQLMGTDPTSWQIVDGKLYLAHSAPVLRIWSGDVPGYLVQSEANWPAVLFD